MKLSHGELCVTSGRKMGSSECYCVKVMVWKALLMLTCCHWGSLSLDGLLGPGTLAGPSELQLLQVIAGHVYA